MTSNAPAKDPPGVYWPAMQAEMLGLPHSDDDTRTRALTWLMRRGHRDIAVMLGLLPDGGEQ